MTTADTAATGTGHRPRIDRPPRIGIVDGVRGAACVVMIVWHTADAWLTDALHGTWGFGRIELLGGFAAPLFLWLAGLSLALSTELRPSGARTGAALVRAGWVVAIGYALKLFAWTVDRGAIVEPSVNGRTLLVAIPSMAALLLALREPTRLGTRARVVAGLAGVAGLLVSYSHLEGATRSPVVLTRLDVLHGIGAALAVIALVLFALGRVVRTEATRALALAVLAICVALATPHFVGASLDPLPTRLADYVARTTHDPAASGARFALFPWLGHALFGASVGTLLRRAPRDLGLSHVPFVARPWLLAATALAVMIAVFEAGPLAPAITSRAEWTRPVLRLVFYGSAAMGTAGLLAYLGRAAPRSYAGLGTMGRSSLLVYGAHLELAYGLAGVPIQRTLGWVGWAIGATALVALMTGLAGALENREKRGSPSGHPRPASGGTG